MSFRFFNLRTVTIGTLLLLLAVLGRVWLDARGGPWANRSDAPNIIPEYPSTPSADRIVMFEGYPIVRDQITVILNTETVNPTQRIVQIAEATNGVIIGAVPSALIYSLRYDVSNPAELRSVVDRIKVLPDVSSAGLTPLLGPAAL
jgi:hypothetical protein